MARAAFVCACEDDELSRQGMTTQAINVICTLLPSLPDPETLPSGSSAVILELQVPYSRRVQTGE